MNCVWKRRKGLIPLVLHLPRWLALPNVFACQKLQHSIELSHPSHAWSRTLPRVHLLAVNTLPPLEPVVYLCSCTQPSLISFCSLLMGKSTAAEGRRKSYGLCSSASWPWDGDTVQITILWLWGGRHSLGSMQSRAGPHYTGWFLSQGTVWCQICIMMPEVPNVTSFHLPKASHLLHYVFVFVLFFFLSLQLSFLTF